jgi:SAM-dependent methyltransferase
MAWRVSQEESRRQWLAAMDSAAVEKFEDQVGKLSPEEKEAYLEELAEIPIWKTGASVLDVGAGTGTLSQVIAGLNKDHLFALEPSALMVDKLCANLAGTNVQARVGFSDSPEDRTLFPPGKFQVIVSRQLVNGLFDPLVAFGNWLDWLSPGGSVIVVEGAYTRAAWTGVGEEFADLFPVSSNQSLALIPYLLEVAGFRVEKVRWMQKVNRLPGTRTPRYLVHATKPFKAG